MHSQLKIIVNKDKPVYSVSDSDTLITAAKKMAEHRVGSLLVISQGKLQGIITERDFLFKASAKLKDLTTTTVKEIMSDHIISMKDSHTAQEALQLMTEKRIRHLPVYDDKNKFLGLLSIGDLTKWASSRYHEKHDEVENLVNYIQQ
ncbi:CBS domain-containing protein [Fangia hongkongensis]|uniref:CBS domain-containing protein n=1 Tax=Fangia hongkongensis TaxID=270495 RepID=UPI00037A9B9D|nr:CBS domain-containing protein [Fangia hongkongensis]MBK2124702.1 CBS domain-containing protein [Fangia hongkongensis]